jgi:aminoglycoside phosphotransferase (APT) family kinase protein
MTDAAGPVDDRSEIRAGLLAMGLIGPAEAVHIQPLSGGVSCDVYRVDLAARTICLKRALPKLRVKADWRASTERAASEVNWLTLAAQIVPDSVPAVLGEDRARHMFAMAYLPPEEFPVWKARLADGHIEPAFAALVGTTLARFHAATAGRPEIALAFANDPQFLALRLDPFLLHVARTHGELAPELQALADGIAQSRIALMHGDVSPKNILSGPHGPVFLDAETTCYGDPAFDLAFCLNQLLLKCVWHPKLTGAYLQSFTALTDAYLDGVDWEEPRGPEARAARLLPALLLARIDGKSPVEYLTDDREKDFVRSLSRTMLHERSDSLAAISETWAAAVSKTFVKT